MDYESAVPSPMMLADNTASDDRSNTAGGTAPMDDATRISASMDDSVGDTTSMDASVDDAAGDSILMDTAAAACDKSPMDAAAACDKSPMDAAAADDNTTMDAVPSDNAPMDDTPVDNISKDDTALDNAPMDATPADNTPREDASEDDSQKVHVTESTASNDNVASGSSEQAPASNIEVVSSGSTQTARSSKPAPTLPYAVKEHDPEAEAYYAMWYKHPAPLPREPKYKKLNNCKMKPPRPATKAIKHASGGCIRIRLTWYIDLTPEHADIWCFQVYAYQEKTTIVHPRLWRKVSNVPFLQVAMGCTLAGFVDGYRYHFAVRAVDVHKRIGPFGNVVTVRYRTPKKDAADPSQESTQAT